MSQITDNVNADYRRIRQGLAVEPAPHLSMREAIQFADQLSAYPVDLDECSSSWDAGFRKPDLAMDQAHLVCRRQPASRDLSAMPSRDRAPWPLPAPYLIIKVRGHVRKLQRQLPAGPAADWSTWPNGSPANADVLRADVIHEPLNTRTDADLQGGIATRGDNETAEFELRIVMELGHEPA